MFRALFFPALVLFSCLHANASNFPKPAALEPAVQFWVKVYTKVTTNQGYIHDDEQLSVIYETMDLPASGNRDARNREIKAAIMTVSNALSALGMGKRTGLSGTEAKVLAAWPAGTPSREFAQAAHRVRFQLGQSDRFKAGLVRSGQWKPHIRRVLAQYELPPELVVLPHVESSFDPTAYSKVAAAGMWQFMPATARQYMRVDHVVDERMDPFIATEGAARLLKTNYKTTGTWPLAITGYNHGAAGMTRAARVVGTSDIDVIVKKYKGTAFGFASRNFYASFLAALQIDNNPERYFGTLKLDTPIPYDVITPQNYISATALARAAGLSVDELRQHNPALLETVWSGEKYIPRGHPVRVPEVDLDRPLDTALASLSADAVMSEQKPDLTHRIAQGDSLSTIAQRYGTSVSKLRTINGLRGDSIRAGKYLVLPGNANQGPLTAEHVAATRVRLAASKPREQEYVIQSGDSLWSIARRFKVSTEQLVAWNGISTRKYLQPGQKLRIGSAG